MADEQLSGGEPFNMLDHVMSKRFKEREETTKTDVQEPSPAAPADTQYKAELDTLRRELAEARRETTEVRSLAERQTGALQTYLQQQSQQKPQEEEFPVIEVTNPELAAAMNALKNYTDKQLGNIKQMSAQERQQQTIEQNYNRYQQALAEVRQTHPDFKNLFTQEQLDNYVKPYLNNPNINWKQELESVSKAAHYSVLQAELAAANKKLAEVEKKTERQKAEQKENLKLVPGIGQRTQGAPSGVPVGDQIIKGYKGKGKMSFQQFGSELQKRLGI